MAKDGVNTPTPMMVQFLDIKADHRDALLFYRMGDFYEMFFGDAVAASQALGIALTKRGKHLGKDIPMCGVPVHSAEGYFLTLIRKGFRVAVCEQLEDPAEAKKRGSKSVVKRGVVRLVTPGTLTEDSLLNARQHNYLAAFSEIRGEGALAWVDISTGAFNVVACTPARLGPELSRLAPKELVVPQDIEANYAELVTEMGVSLTPVARSSFDSDSAVSRLCSLFNSATLDGFGNFSREEISAMGAIVDYLELTQKGKLPLLRPPAQEKSGQIMQIDATTRRSLELTRSMAGGRDGSLIAAIDRTVTAGGGRLLERRLASPTLNLPVISARHDAISYLLLDPLVSDGLRQTFRQTPDMDRAISRLSLDRAGPRDLGAVRDGLSQAKLVAGLLRDCDLPDLLLENARYLEGHDELLALLDAALVGEPSMLVRDGGFIASGYDKDLDEARTLRDEGRGVIGAMQKDFVDQTGISALKIKHNNVLGYFIETTATHAQKMLSPPLSDTFVHRQTTANAVRFTTIELSEIETRILNAGSRALEIEKRLYSMLSDGVLEQSSAIFQTANSIAELDLSAAFAHLARSEDWCRPAMDDSRDLEVANGRHPVVEMSLRNQAGDPFVANDCSFDAVAGSRIWLLTGPNMAGKSTFLRQNALIVLLAQIGSFVPATSARVGLVSQLFSRVGASDDLARGRSTFMVEMVETAAILNQADDRAFVILDEIGRGTATYDGLSIAWATLEHLHDVNSCRALFATHYHELTQLADTLTGVDNATVSVKEWDGDVVFLHEVKKGAADRSYGVQVAKLAGLPDIVVNRARVVLEALEKGEREGGATKKAVIDDLPLFATTPQIETAAAKKSPALDLLEAIEPDELSAKQALDLLYEIKRLTRD